MIDCQVTDMDKFNATGMTLMCFSGRLVSGVGEKKATGFFLESVLLEWLQ